MSPSSKPGRSQYTENQVAHELGVSVEYLRALIRERIMPNDDDVHQISVLTFEPSDVLLLRLLASRAVEPPQD